MLPAQRDPVATERDVHAAWRSQLLFIAGLCLILAALGLRLIGAAETDLPSLASFAQEATTVYQPIVEGRAAPELEVIHTHRTADRWWKRAWLAANGRWDHRLLSVAGLPLIVAAAGLLLAGLARSLSPAKAWALLVGVAASAVLSPWSPRPDADSAGWALSLLFALMHLHCAAQASQTRRTVGIGAACGLLATVCATIGLAAVAASTAWLLARRRNGSSSPADGPLSASLRANGVIFAAGLSLALLRGFSEEPPAIIVSLLSGPFASPLGAVLLWTPAIIAVVRSLVGRWPEALDHKLGLFALWALFQVVVFATWPEGAASARSLGAVWITINAACLAALPGSVRQRFVVASLWTVALFGGLLAPASEKLPAPPGPAFDHPTAEAMARVVFRNETDLPDVTDSTEDHRVSELRAVLQQSSLRTVLPPSLAVPLPIDAARQEGDWTGTPPAASGRSGLSASGTWRDGLSPGAGTGVFDSRIVRPSTAFVQLRLAGEFARGSTEVSLKTGQGTVLPLHNDRVSSPDRWKRTAAFVAGKPFSIHAMDTSTTAWTAFTWPQELPAPSWAASKAARLWWPWLLIGLGFAGWAAVRAAAAFLRAPPAASDPARSLGAALPALALAGYIAVCAPHLDTTAGPADSGGYLNGARIFAAGGITAPARTLPADVGPEDPSFYLPRALKPQPDGRVSPSFPPGVPFLIALFGMVMPLSAAIWISILLHAILGLGMTRKLALQCGLPAGWATFAASLIALSPLFLLQGWHVMSDVPSLAWVTAAVVWAWRARTSPAYALLAAAATTLAVLIRPTNLLCVVPVLVCLWGAWRALAAWAAAGIPGALFLAWYQSTLYGGPLNTGYGSVSGLFAAAFVWPTLKAYVAHLPVLLTPLVLLAPVLPILPTAGAPRVRLLLTVWMAAFLGVYAFYFCTHYVWTDMRFVLPAFPALAVAALLVVRRLLTHLRLPLPEAPANRRQQLLSVIAIASVLAFPVAQGVRYRVFYWLDQCGHHAQLGRWVAGHCPPDAVVFAQHAGPPLYFYTDLVVAQLDHPASADAAAVERIARSGRPIYAVTHQSEQQGYKAEHPVASALGPPPIPGRWTQVASFADGLLLVWKREATEENARAAGPPPSLSGSGGG